MVRFGTAVKFSSEFQEAGNLHLVGKWLEEETYKLKAKALSRSQVPKKVQVRKGRTDDDFCREYLRSSRNGRYDHCAPLFSQAFIKQNGSKWQMKNQ